jgi:4-amino-4-deoxy-L-arabinose transferase-like glycosyltransferase
VAARQVSQRRQLILLLLAALALRLLFVHQAFQLDDAYYLTGARYVQTDPAHPFLAKVAITGVEVDMRGHPHPAFDVWFLGLLLWLFGAAREVPLHLVYALFTLLATAAVFFLARRFTSRPAIATLLFIATPAFVVHGNGLESDIPFLALVLAGVAGYLYAVDRVSRPLLWTSAAFLAPASLAAYQALFLVPVLGWYAWTRKRGWRAAFVVAALPVIVIAAYQIYVRASAGALPAAVLMGHFGTYHLQSLHNKLSSAAALTAHMGWILFPLLALAAFGRFRGKLWIAPVELAMFAAFIDYSPLFWASFAIGGVVLIECARGWREADEDSRFLRAWVLVFFACSLVVFFAGSARYLLPLAPAVIMLAVRALDRRPKWLLAGFALQLAFALPFAWSHYQWSNAYREFVRGLEPRLAGHRVFTNGEWGLQYYGQQAGAKPLLHGDVLKPGDIVLTSELGYSIPLEHPGSRVERLAEFTVRPQVPLRLIALNSRSAFSTITFGVRPFDITSAPADVLHADIIVANEPSLSYVPMDAPEAGEQIAGGVFGLENGGWRWVSDKATILLKRPAGESRIEAEIVIPDSAPARRVTLILDGATVADRTFPAPGSYTLSSAPIAPGKGTATLIIQVDRTFSAPGDQRRLAVILKSAGFR